MSTENDKAGRQGVGRRRRCGPALAAAIILAGCSGGDDVASLAARSSSQTTTDTTATTAAGATTGQSTRSTAAEKSAAADDGSPPTTVGSGLPPVTTIPGPPGGDPDKIYQGVLGDLGPDDLIVEPVAEAPTIGAGKLPLTGLDGPVPDRPVAVVKVDNGPAAGPQTGLNSADIVVEEEVEGGVTRFAAFFHSTASIVGPVRSGRTSDVSLVSSLGEPLYLYSGANDITEMILRRQDAIQNRGYGSSSGYWRDETRQAPSNVYTDTAPHWSSANGGPPAPQFWFRDAGQEAVGRATDEFVIGYPASPVRWIWRADHWERYQRGARHDLASGLPVTAANVVVVELDRVATGMVDSAGGQVPESVFVGSGPAVVFTDGQRLEGRWTRPTLTSVATLTDIHGEPLRLTPGRTWIQLVELGSGALQ